MEFTSGADMEINWQWLLWQVGIPLGGPIVLSCLIVLLWQTGMPDFVPQWSIILDFSPWTLTFYALALIGGALYELWPYISTQRSLGSYLIGAGSAAQLYAAFLVVWRHNSAFAPTRGIYICASGILLLAVVLSHKAFLKSRGN